MGILILVLILSIIFDGIADGFYIRALSNKENKWYGYSYHGFYALVILMLLIAIISVLNLPMKYINIMRSEILLSSLCIIGGYTLIRYGIFDWIVNAVSGKHWLYIGETSYMDVLQRKIFNTPISLMFYVAFKMISLIAGLSILQRFIEFI